MRIFKIFAKQQGQITYEHLKKMMSKKVHPRLIKYLNRGYTFPEVDYFNIKKDVHSGMISSLDAVIAIKINGVLSC